MKAILKEYLLKNKEVFGKVFKEKSNEVNRYVLDRKLLNKLRLIFYIDQYQIEFSKNTEEMYSIYVQIDNKIPHKNIKIVFQCYRKDINEIGGVHKIIKPLFDELTGLRVNSILIILIFKSI